MSKLIVLDAGPLGVISNPNFSPDTIACTRWLNGQLKAKVEVVISEVADYEVRRELLRLKRTRSIAALDQLKVGLNYQPITSAAMLRAAEFWARARQMGRPTAADSALDADMIIAAQASLLIDDGDEAIVATTNPKHLSLFIPASRWQEIN